MPLFQLTNLLPEVMPFPQFKCSSKANYFAFKVGFNKALIYINSESFGQHQLFH
jgi:hypothetical protein